MTILGIGGSAHDYSCTILVDGQVKVSIEEERISREKYSVGKRSSLLKCIEYCLDAVKMTLDDMDYIVSNDLLKLNSFHKHLNKIIYINHHIAHCASSYYTSGMDEAACLVVDGFGTMYRDDKSEAFSLYHADRKKGISLLYNSTCDIYPNKASDKNWGLSASSIGIFYSIVTHLCGFTILQEGKTMGLASYGKPKYVDEFSKFIELKCNNKEPYLDFNSNEFIEFGSDLLKDKNINDNFDDFADVAYAGQIILENVIFDIMNHLYSITKVENLVYAGGVALNSVLNGKIKKHTPFNEVFIYPAAGDSGTGIGAALYLYHDILKKPYNDFSKIKTVYLGKEYTEQDVETCLNKYSDKLSFEKYSFKDLYKIAATKISENKIIGWFQGRTEVGPRALGNRSILANPSNADMKDILNHRVKFREHFRPFAPTVLKEYIDDYFASDFKDNPYMLFVCDVLNSMRSCIPAVVHVDGTARIQTISCEDNEHYYNLIKVFYELSGLPMLINTSFNIRGKPIVETPREAIVTFLNCDMDELFLFDYHITKKCYNAT